MPVNVHDTVLPTFSSTLESEVYLNVGNAKEWTLPEPDASPYNMADVDPVTVGIPDDLKYYLTFDSEDQTFIWIDDLSAQELVSQGAQKEFELSITLKNS